MSLQIGHVVDLRHHNGVPDRAIKSFQGPNSFEDAEKFVRDYLKTERHIGRDYGDCEDRGLSKYIEINIFKF